METASALVSPSSVVGCVTATFNEETTTTGSTAKVKSKPKTKGRQQQQTHLEESRSADIRHQARGRIKTMKATTMTTTNIDNNNSENIDRTRRKCEEQCAAATNNVVISSDKKEIVNGDEEESCDPKNHEDFSAAKTLLKRSDIAADEEEEDDEDNWESLIDNGTLDKSLERFRIKDSNGLNNMNSELQKEYQEREKGPSGPIKINVRLEEPSRTSTPPTFKILRREVATTAGMFIPSNSVVGEPKTNMSGDAAANGQNAGTHRATSHRGVPTPPAGKTFAQRQEEYARARMRILGCPGNGNGPSPSAASPAAQLTRTHTGAQLTQKSLCGTVGRGFGSDSTSRRGSYPGGAHRRHNLTTPPSQGYPYGNSSVHQQHHQNNNTYSNNGYYSGSRASLHGPLNNGGFHGTGGNQNPSLSTSAAAAVAMHRPNAGTYGR